METIIDIQNCKQEFAHGGSLRWLTSLVADQSETGIWYATISPKKSTDPQFHNYDEIVIVLSGHARVTLDDREFEIREKQVLTIPAQVTHRVENIGEEELIAILVMPKSILSYQPNGDEAHSPATIA